MAKNGLHGTGHSNYYLDVPFAEAYWAGGGYYQGPENYSVNNEKLAEICLGGFGGTAYWRGHAAGCGGAGGIGGDVKVSTNSKIFAFNGNLYTDGTEYLNGINQAPIYLQAGIKIAKYDIVSWGNHDWGSPDNEKYPFHTNCLTMGLVSAANNNIDMKDNQYENTIYSLNNSFKSKKFININSLLGVSNNPLSNVDMSKQGVGSGAGYAEISNGKYIIDRTGAMD